jgi:hypothetical protein
VATSTDWTVTSNSVHCRKPPLVRSFSTGRIVSTQLEAPIAKTLVSNLLCSYCERRLTALFETLELSTASEDSLPWLCALETCETILIIAHDGTQYPLFWADFRGLAFHAIFMNRSPFSPSFSNGGRPELTSALPTNSWGKFVLGVLERNLAVVGQTNSKWAWLSASIGFRCDSGSDSFFEVTVPNEYCIRTQMVRVGKRTSVAARLRNHQVALNFLHTLMSAW